MEALEKRLLLTADHLPAAPFSGALAGDHEWTDLPNVGTYVISGDLVVPAGVTLTIGAGVHVSIAAGKTLRIQSSGVVNIGHDAQIAIDDSVSGVSGGIVIAGGGALTATTANFVRSGGAGGSSTSIDVQGHGTLAANNSLFDWDDLILEEASVTNLGASSFKATVNTSYDHISDLTDNQLFTDVVIRTGELSNQKLGLSPLGSGSVNMRYLLQSFTIDNGATLNVTTGTNIVFQDGQTLTVAGMLNVDGANFHNQELHNSGAQGIEVAPGGVMNVKNTTFDTTGGYAVKSQLKVDGSGRLTGSGNTYAWDALTFDSASILFAGDIINNDLNTVVTAPAVYVPLLASNHDFHDVELLGGELTSGQTLTLAPLGTDGASNLHMEYLLQSFTIDNGATLNVTTGTNIVFQDSQTLTVAGTLNVVGANFHNQELHNSGAQGIEVVPGGLMNVKNTTFDTAGGYAVRSQLKIDGSGHLIGSGNKYAWDALTFDAASLLATGDLVNNDFNTVTTTPALYVPLLASNYDFHDVVLLGGDLLKDQTLTLNPLGTDAAANTNMRYLLQNFTIDNGATLNVTTGTKVVFQDSQNLIVGGALNVDGADFQNQELHNSGFQGIEVVLGGAMNVRNTTFDTTGGYAVRSQLLVDGGGSLVATKNKFYWDQLTLAGDSTVDVSLNTFGLLNTFNPTIQISTAASTRIVSNDFTNASIQAVGGTVGHLIDLTNNWWGTTDATAIQLKVPVQVSFSPFLTLPPHSVDMQATSLVITGGHLVAGQSVDLQYKITLLSPSADSKTFHTSTYFSLSAPGVTSPVATLAVVPTTIIEPPAGGPVSITFVMNTTVQLPPANDAVWTNGLPALYTISMRADAFADVVEWDETNNIVSSTVPVIPATANPNSVKGDYNYNGVVDAADYVVWRDEKGSQTFLAADGDGSGTVDNLDYDFWRAHFGNTSASGAGTGSFASESVTGDSEGASALAPIDKSSLENTMPSTEKTVTKTSFSPFEVSIDSTFKHETRLSPSLFGAGVDRADAQPSSLLAYYASVKSGAVKTSFDSSKLDDFSLGNSCGDLALEAADQFFQSLAESPASSLAVVL